MVIYKFAVMKFEEKIKSSLIIGIVIIITGWILGKSFKNRNESLDSISVN